MLKRGKVLALILVFSMLFASVAYAAVPNNSVVIGSKAYSIDYLMVEANIPEINQAVAENGNNPIFYQLPGVAETWTDVMTSQPATPEQIAAWPEITYKDAQGNVTRYGAGNGEPVVEQLTVVSVSAITITKLKVELDTAVDSASAANFQISGMTVTAATLDASKKVVTLTVTGAQTGKDYTLTVTGLKVNAVTMPDATKAFTMPNLGDLYTYSITLPDTVIKADGASQSLATFKIVDKEGNIATNAQDVEVAFATTFGSFAEQRVSVQNGVATNMLTSEFLTVDRTALITATIVEAADASLIGKKAETSIVMSPNPGSASENFGASMTAAEADQADRVIAYFNKDVSVSGYDPDNDGAVFDAGTGYSAFEKASVMVRKDSVSAITGTACAVKGLMPVTGNTKALQILLDVETSSANALTDNSDVYVEFTDKTGTLPVTKSATFRLTDARKPAMLSVANEGLNVLKVTFSEPVNADPLKFNAQDENNWTIDGTLLSDVATWGAATAEVGQFDPATGTDLRKVVTITLGAGKYFAPGNHSIQAANIGDWAALSDNNNVMNTQTLDFNIPVDNEAPTATVEVQSPEQWLITFNKDVLENATQFATNITLEKYNTTTAAWETDARVASVGTAAVNDTNLNLVVTKIVNNKFLVQTDYDWTRVYNTAANHKNYFNDQFRLKIAADAVTNVANGKKNVEQTLTLGGVMTYADTTSPVISEIKEVTPGALYQATMSEPVKLSSAANAEGATASQLQGSDGWPATWSNIPVPTAEFIKKDLSKTIPATIGATFVDSYNKVLSITPDAALDAGDWTLVIRSISDDVGNTAASATKDFTVTGPAPVATNFKVLWAFADIDTDKVVENKDTADGDASYDYIFVKFNKAVSVTGDYKNALKTANYTLDGVALPTGTQILANIAGYDDLDGVTDSVTIRLPQGALQGKNSPHVLNISSKIESTTAGETLSNGGEITLPFNADPVVMTADVNARALVDAAKACSDACAAGGIGAGEIAAFDTAYHNAQAAIAALAADDLVKAQYQAAIDSYKAAVIALPDFATYMSNTGANFALTGVVATGQLTLTVDGVAVTDFSSARYTVTNSTPAVATINNATGKVTAVAAGNTTISVKDNFWGLTDTVTVTVDATPSITGIATN